MSKALLFVVLVAFGDASRLKKTLQTDFHSSGHKVKAEVHRSTSGATEVGEGPEGPLSLEECKELLEIGNLMIRELRMVGMLKDTLKVHNVPREQIHAASAQLAALKKEEEGPLSLEECKELLEIEHLVNRELRMVSMLKDTLKVRKVSKKQIHAGMAQLAALKKEEEVSLPKPSGVRPWDGNFNDERTIRYYKMKQVRYELPQIRSRVGMDRVFLEKNMEPKAIECIPILLLFVTTDLNENFLLPYTRHGETPYTPEQKEECRDLFPNVRFE